MRTYAEYYLTCECGKDVRSVQPEFQCPHCSRHIVINWRARDEENQSAGSASA